MARSLASKTNVIAPGGSYPFGRVRDNDGSANGTPANEALFGDMTQFFEKLLSDAAVVANGNPENNSDGFQYIEALLKNISYRVGSRQAGTDLDNEKFAGIFNIAGTDANVPAGLGTLGQLIVSGKLDTVVFQRVVDVQNGAEWIRTFTAPATWSAWTLIRFAQKNITFSGWNMDTSPSFGVAHGLADSSKIKSIDIFIKNNANTVYVSLMVSFSGAPQGGLGWIDVSTPGEVDLWRIDGANPFDTAGYNNASGIMFITYDPS